MNVILNRLPTVARLLLGLMFFVFGLNGFLHFLPAPPPGNDAAVTFIGALFAIRAGVTMELPWWLAVAAPVALYAILAAVGLPRASPGCLRVGERSRSRDFDPRPPNSMTPDPPRRPLPYEVTGAIPRGECGAAGRTCR